MGVKPLYYCVTGDRLHFASRPRALQILDSTVSREIDEQALRLYLECGFVPAPHTIHRAIRKLPPAHYLTFDETGLKITQYWDFRAIRPDRSLKQRPERELLDELDSLVSESVRLRTVSDVPLGSLLSGGIDSALVTAMLAKHSPKKIQAFTIGFDDPAFDESGPAQEIAAHLGIVHHTERLRVDDLLELMPMFREEFDEPLADSSAFPVMAVSRLARKYVTVALSGDGGDELFGGYHYYAIAKALGKAYALPEVLRSASAAILDTAGYHKAHMLAGALRQKAFPEAFAFSRSIAKDFPSVLTEDVLGGTAGIDELYRIYAAAYLSDLGNLDQAMRLDMAFTLPDDYLQKIDVGSMAFSLEGREPLLDHVLVEWAMRLPDVWKVRGFGSKYLLRRLARRYIPRTILDRPKRGFGVPMARWLRGPLTEWASDTIRRRKLYDVLPIRPKIVQGLLDLHLSGKRDVSPLLWAILVLSDFVSFDDATRS
jgi:asparagine synthase (glutamine-hydrolysing)